MLNYITFNKLADIWLDPHLEDELNYRILRTICYYYIREHLVTAVLTSQKLQAQSKPIHLNSRRQLMKFFRNEDHWWFVLYGFEQILYSVSDIERKLGSCISVRPSFPNYWVSREDWECFSRVNWRHHRRKLAYKVHVCNLHASWSWTAELVGWNTSQEGKQTTQEVNASAAGLRWHSISLKCRRIKSRQTRGTDAAPYTST